MRARSVLAFPLLAVACGGASALPPARETPGRVVVVNAAPLPEDHPSVPVGDPSSNNDRVGRAPRRLNVDQLRASLLAATGYTWVAGRRVFDSDSPSGTSQLPDADMLEALAATLGRPDYLTSTSESIDPAVTFAKLASDAARSACRASVKADLVPDARERNILRHVGPQDTLANNPSGIKENLSYLALRFWGRKMPSDDPQLAPLAKLFERVARLPADKDPQGKPRPGGTPAEGWRAVCIAMATDPQFLMY